MIELTIDEQRFLASDAFVLRCLIDAYRAGLITDDSTWIKRETILKDALTKTTVQPLESALIGDITPQAYRMSLKIVRSYEHNFKTENTR